MIRKPIICWKFLDFYTVITSYIVVMLILLSIRILFSKCKLGKNVYISRPGSILSSQLVPDMSLLINILTKKRYVSFFIGFIIAVIIATWLLWLGADVSINEIYKVCPIYIFSISLGKILIIIFPYILQLFFLVLLSIIIVECKYKGFVLQVINRIKFYIKIQYFKNEIFINNNWGFAVIAILTVIIVSIFISIFKGWLYTSILLWLSLLYKFWSYYHDPKQFRLDLSKTINISSFILFLGLIFVMIPSLMLYKEDPLNFHIYCENILFFRCSFMQLLLIFLVYVYFYKPNTKENRIKIYNILSTLLICGLSFIIIIEFFKELILGSCILIKDIHEGGNLTIEVSTTLPRIEDNLPLPIISDRLILRPLVLSDLEAHHTLRGQPEAMAHSRRGKPDANIEETLAHLKRMPDTYFGIFLKNSDGSEGELIGDGGVHKFVSEKTGWPEFGYKFKKEYWGQGYATEFANVFMDFWGNLPRNDTRIVVASSSIVLCKDTSYAAELVCAWTTEDNLASQNVLKKVGFKLFEGMNNGFVNWRKIFEKVSVDTCQYICHEYSNFRRLRTKLL